MNPTYTITIVEHREDTKPALITIEVRGDMKVECLARDMANAGAHWLAETLSVAAGNCGYPTTVHKVFPGDEHERGSN